MTLREAIAAGTLAPGERVVLERQLRDTARRVVLEGVLHGGDDAGAWVRSSWGWEWVSFADGWVVGEDLRRRVEIAEAKRDAAHATGQIILAQSLGLVPAAFRVEQLAREKLAAAQARLRALGVEGRDGEGGR